MLEEARMGRALQEATLRLPDRTGGTAHQLQCSLGLLQLGLEVGHRLRLAGRNHAHCIQLSILCRQRRITGIQLGLQ